MLTLALAALLLTPALAQEGGDVADPSTVEPAASAAPEAPGDAAPEDPLSPYRTPFPVLTERTIGSTARAVEFDWRRSRVQFAAVGNHYYELNNFDSLRAGALVRRPSDRMMFELGLSYVWVWDTPSSKLLALTPYRQPGRPKRMEIDLAVGYPLAEGVVTTFPRLFPAVEMIFSAYGGLRYALYPMSFEGMTFREVAGALAAPTLTETELDNLEERRLRAMQVDPARYGLLVGVGNDLYFRQGVFIAPRMMMAVPLLAPATGTDLLFWADLSIAIGVAL